MNRKIRTINNSGYGYPSFDILRAKIILLSEKSRDKKVRKFQESKKGIFWLLAEQDFETMYVSENYTEEEKEQWINDRYDWLIKNKKLDKNGHLVDNEWRNIYKERLK